MGHVHISFEYHIHKSSLKIRIWQLSDLLLPPPQISMIQSVYVRSYLTPSDNKKCLQRTEEVRVENLEAHVNVKPQEQKPLTGIQHIFTPSNFKFLTPLEYSNIGVDSIREKSVQIEVCMIQKSSRKTFLIGMINIPLKTAVKKVVREKIPLIPCLNYTTPNNMRVYSASDLDLEGNGDLFYSSPSLKQLNGYVSPEFEGVIVPDDSLIQPVHIKIRHKKRDNNDNNINLNNYKIKKNNCNPNVIANSVKEKTVSETPKNNVNSPTTKATDKKLIKVNMNDLELSDVVSSNGFVDVPLEASIVGNGQIPNNKKTKISVPVDLQIDGSDNEIENTLSNLSVNTPIASRPETPVWDYYDFEFEEGGSKPKPKEMKNSTSSQKSDSSDVVRSN